MTTSKPITQNHIQQTLFALDSLAKISAQQDKAKVSPKKLGQVFFSNSCESFAWFDPDTSSWKTWQRSLITDWELYLESWPRQGSIVNGRAYLQVHWEPVIKETGGGWLRLPTPTKQDFKRRGPNSKQQGLSNTENWAMLPTPVATDYKGRSGQGFQDRHGAKRIADVLTKIGDRTSLNPSFVEEMMGYPIGYTA